MKRLTDVARQRLVDWMGANRHITQMTIAKAVGVSQSWVSQYKSGDVDADIDQLDAMAGVFGHTLMELVDLRPDPKETELIDAYRATPASSRPLIVAMAKGLAGQPPPEPPPTRKRNS